MTDDQQGRRRFLGAATLAAAAAAVPGGAAAQRSPGAEETQPMTGSLTADEIRTLLGLQPNQTCGYVRETYKSALQLGAGALPTPFEAARPVGTGLYFMMTPAEPVKLHRIQNDQLYHYYMGDAIEVQMLHADGTSERAVVGPDLRAGQRVQLFIPGGTFHTARLITARLIDARPFFLGASTEWPGVIPADVEIGDVEALAARYPDVADDIRAFPQPVRPG
jgi:predicted cupin superfamily sugar epimerase